MSKFIPKIKELSSKFYASASKASAPTSESQVVAAETLPATEGNGATATAALETAIDSHAASAESESNTATAVAEPVTEETGDLAPEQLPQPSVRQPLKIPQPLIAFFTHPVSKEIIGLVFSRRPVFLRLWFWLTMGLGGSLVGLSSAWVYLEKQLPESTVDVVTYVRDNTLTIKAADGSILQQQGEATREKLKIKEIPNTLVEAFIAIEDRRFYSHDGADYQGILRAVISNLQARGVVEGASTITQQLARIVFLDQDRKFMRKAKEIRLAQKIEQSLDKEQILERYLNLVYLGSGAYGVADAAWVYFSKKVNQLTLPEMATLAGLPPAPSEYSPFRNKEIARKRRNIVLQEMLQAGYITPEQAKEAIASPLTVKPSPPKRLNRASHYFTEYIQQELPTVVSKQVLEMGGLTVETTLNPKWQELAEKAVQETVKENGPGQNFEQAAMVGIDPRNGQIQVMVGGKNFGGTQFNRTTQAKRQPGSTFKMFVYTTAIASGISPYKSYEDAPLIIDGYTPKNFSAQHRGSMSIRDAIKSSINIVAVKVLLDVGWDPIIEIAKKMGIESKLYPSYSLALGASEVTMLELTGAYGTLATQGAHIKPHGIRRIFDRRGNLVYQANFKKEQVLDKDTAAIMTWLLQGVVNEGTGVAAQLDNRPVAGKTGTSDQARDLWFVGYIPQLAVSVWLGNDNNQPTWGSSGTAAATWRNFVSKAVEGMPVEKFPELPNLDDRKPQIKRKPIKPRNIIYGTIEREENTEGNRRSYRPRYNRNDDDNDNTPVYRRTRQYSSEEQSAPVRSRRRESSEEAPPRRRRSEAPSAGPAPAPPSSGKAPELPPGKS